MHTLESTYLHKLLFVLLSNIVTDCGAPFNDSGVIIEPFNDTILGSLITFRCDNSMSAVCGSSGEWSPNPASSKEVHTHKYYSILSNCLKSSDTIASYIIITVCIKILCAAALIISQK